MVSLVAVYGSGFQFAVTGGMLLAALISAFAMWLTIKQHADDDALDEHEKRVKRLEDRIAFLQQALDQSERTNQELMRRLLRLGDGQHHQ